MPHSEDRIHWENEIPPIEAIYERGGEPGKRYAYVSAERAPEAQEKGLRQVPGSPIFSLRGPGGEARWVVMEDGEGIPGVRPEAARPEVRVDDRLLSVLERPAADAPSEGDGKTPEEESEEASSASPTPVPNAERRYRLPCGAEKEGKRSANGHFRFCKDTRCELDRLAGKKVDAFEFG